MDSQVVVANIFQVVSLKWTAAELWLSNV